MPTYGANSPSGSVGTFSTPFTNPNNMLVLDSVYATSAPASGGFSNSAYLSGYGFNILPTDIITNLTVRIYHQGAPAGRVFLVRYFYGGVLQAFNGAEFPISAGPSVAVISGDLAYWNSTTLTPLLANGANFGPVIFDRNKTDATVATLQVDYVSMEIETTSAEQSFRLNQRPWRVP